MSVVDRIMALQKCPCPNPRNLWMLHIKRYFADVIKEFEVVKLFCIIWIGLYNHKGPHKRGQEGQIRTEEEQSRDGEAGVI